MKYQSEVLKEIIDKEGHITSLLHYESECIGYGSLWGKIVIRIEKSKLSTDTVNGFSEFVRNNTITVAYPKIESIKTVDLKTINENGEQVRFKPIEGTMLLSTSGETIKPTFSGEIPVEATTQNLESFIGDE